jgi:hypothetical protein
LIHVNELRSGSDDSDRCAIVAATVRSRTAAASVGHLRVGIGLMDWRLKRINGVEPAWARFDGLERNWSWTTDETQAFVAHNRYIVEAMQRRAPDWLRYASEVELKDSLVPDDPVRKRATKREVAQC